MDAKKAHEILLTAIPETGVTTWEAMYNTLQATPEGRQALQLAHTVRRDPVLPFYAKFDRKSKQLNISRQPFPAEPR